MSSTKSTTDAPDNLMPDTAPPLCPAHARIDERGALEMTVGGNNCVACSLNERQQLLDLLAPFAPADASEDSLTVLRRLADFYNTHVGEGRVVVSYPAPAGQGEATFRHKLLVLLQETQYRIRQHHVDGDYGCSICISPSNILQRLENMEAEIRAAKLIKLLEGGEQQ